MSNVETYSRKSKYFLNEYYASEKDPVIWQKYIDALFEEVIEIADTFIESAKKR